MGLAVAEHHVGQLVVVHEAHGVAVVRVEAVLPHEPSVRLAEGPVVAHTERGRGEGTRRTRRTRRNRLGVGIRVGIRVVVIVGGRGLPREEGKTAVGLTMMPCSASAADTDALVTRGRSDRMARPSASSTILSRSLRSAGPLVASPRAATMSARCGFCRAFTAEKAATKPLVSGVVGTWPG